MSVSSSSRYVSGDGAIRVAPSTQVKSGISRDANHSQAFNLQATYRGGSGLALPLTGKPFEVDKGLPHLLHNKLHLLLISGGAFLCLTPFNSEG